MCFSCYFDSWDDIYSNFIHSKSLTKEELESILNKFKRNKYTEFLKNAKCGMCESKTGPFKISSDKFIRCAVECKLTEN